MVDVFEFVICAVLCPKSPTVCDADVDDVAGLSERMRQDHTAMKAVSEHICVGPAQRVRRLIALRQQIQG